MVEDISKIINQDCEKIESKILKAIFKRNNSILDTIDIIDENCFTINDYAIIYKSMVELYKNDDTINAESVQLKIEQSGYSIDDNIIKKLYNESYTSIKIKKTAEILKELYQRRAMLEKLRGLLDAQEQCPTSSHEISDKINDIAMKSNDIISSTDKDTKCCSDKNKILKDIELKLSNKKNDDSIKSGIRVIDEDLGGLKRGRLWTIVADSQVGKSALAVQIATQAQLLNDNLNVIYYSLEMDKDECTERALADLTGIEPRHISDPVNFFTRFDEKTSTFKNYYEEDKNSELVIKYKETIKEGINTLNEFNFHIDDTPDIDMASLEARVKKNNLKWGKVDIIIVDHIGILCSGSPSEVVGKMDEAYSKLKQIAKKLNCVVIALHQFSNELKNDPMRFPNIFALRGSGAPRHYSDVICGIYRPAVYPEIIKDNSNMKDICQLIWQKVRYTAKPDTTNMDYNGFMFIEKDNSEFSKEITIDDVEVDDDEFEI